MDRSPAPRIVAALVLAGGLVATARAADPSPIDPILARWEAKASTRKTLDVRFTRVDRSPTRKGAAEYEGILLIKDTRTAALDLARKGEATTGDRLVWTGHDLRQFDGESKQVFLVPRSARGEARLPDVVCLPFLYGRTAAEVKEHFDILALSEEGGDYLLGIKPRKKGRAPEPFQTAYVVIDKETLLPSRCLLVDADGEGTQDYRVTSIRTNEPIPDDLFRDPAADGWKVIRGRRPLSALINR